MTELEKLPVHGLKVEPMVEPRLNRIKPGLERLSVDGIDPIWFLKHCIRVNESLYPCRLFD